jgi:hypothetical protein
MQSVSAMRLNSSSTSTFSAQRRNAWPFSFRRYHFGSHPPNRFSAALELSNAAVENGAIVLALFVMRDAKLTSRFESAVSYITPRKVFRF